MRNPHQPPPMETSENENRKWSSLPKEALTRIIYYLDYDTDLTRIRGVCPEWRSALPLHEIHPPYHGFRPPSLPSRYPSLPILLTGSRFYFISPLSDSDAESGGALGGRWLTKMAQFGINKRHLFNPFNVDEYFFSSPPITGSINLLDCRVLEVSYVLTLVIPICNPISEKAVGGWNVRSKYIFTALVKLVRELGGGLLFYRLGDNEWTQIQQGKTSRILDIAFYKGKFYAFEQSTWRVGVIDPATVNPPTAVMEFIPAPDIDGSSYIVGNVFIVPGSSRLYLVLGVRRLPEKKPTMLFFMMKEEDDNYKTIISWEQVTSLGDQIFFIGDNVSFALPSSSVNLPQWKPNSICLFTRLNFPLIFNGYMGMKMPEGVECLKSFEFPEYCSYLGLFNLDEEEKGVVPFKKLSNEVYTALFFPPPAWVKWRCPSLGGDGQVISLHALKFIQS